jgi:hypothetical protein
VRGRHRGGSINERTFIMSKNTKTDFVVTYTITEGYRAIVSARTAKDADSIVTQMIEDGDEVPNSKIVHGEQTVNSVHLLNPTDAERRIARKPFFS